MPQTHVDQTYSRLSQITSAPREFDFPRRNAPQALHYVGPLKSESSRPAIDFPFERLASGRPLIYASMGTMQNRLNPGAAGVLEDPIGGHPTSIAAVALYSMLHGKRGDFFVAGSATDAFGFVVDFG